MVDSSEDAGISKEMGIKLKVHEPDEIAFPQDDGFLFEAGYGFTISITAVSGSYLF